MIYLDYNASTPIDPRVRDAMLPYLGDLHGNPSASHALGKKMRAAVDQAREQVAAMIGATPEEIVFTSSGTEASNTVIKGVAHAFRHRGRHMITSAVEHPATRNPCRYLESLGYEITTVSVDQHGLVDPTEVAGAVRGDTILVSIMHANNEVGTIEPIKEIAQIAREGGFLSHTDIAQSVGKIPVDVETLGVDFASIAGHKFYAPQGVGALYIRKGMTIEPLLHGAGHESGRRAGTEAVAMIVGLGKAAELVSQSSDESALTMRRDRLHRGLVDSLGDDAVLLGHPELRLSNTLAIGFRGIVGGDLLAACPELCATTGAACHSGKRERSHVLAAMDVPEEIAFGAVRFSVGRFTTDDEIDRAVRMVADAARSLKQQA